MDAEVDEMSEAYGELVAAVAAVVEARGQSGGENTASMVAATEALKQRVELFRVACDHGEERLDWIRNLIFVDGNTAASFYSSTSSRFGAPSDEVVDEASTAGSGGVEDPFSAFFDEVHDEASMGGGSGDEKDPFSALFDEVIDEASMAGGGVKDLFSALSDEVLDEASMAGGGGNEMDPFSALDEVLHEASMAGGGEKDLFSALSDEVLRLILLSLPSAAAAARTGLISRRWRNLWYTLPELRFPDVTDLARVSAALRLHAAPVLHNLHIDSSDRAPHKVAAVLDMAAPRLAGGLWFDMAAAAASTGIGDVLELEIGGALELEIPCFPKATQINISFGNLRIRGLPSFAVFVKLTVLRLCDVRFDSQYDLGEAISSNRCPSLLVLNLQRAKGLSNLAIRSESLLVADLSHLGGLQQLTIVAPRLTDLGVSRCFNVVAPIADISTPLLEVLRWIDYFSWSSVRFGVMPCLRRLEACGLVYGVPTADPLSRSLPLLERFTAAPDVHLSLFYPRVAIDDNYNFVVEAVNTLSDVKILSLKLVTIGHAFGPCVFHFLMMSLGISELNLELDHCFKDGIVPCFSGCICYKPPDWETMDICLNLLQKVEINNLSGAEVEILFVERLLRWAPVLKMITLTFDPSVRVSKEVCKKLLSLSTPVICMEIYLHINGAKEKYRPPVNMKRPRDD